MNEKRAAERNKIFWTIVRKDSLENDEIGLGFLLNISEKGMNIWIDHQQKLDTEDFNIILYPPENLDSEIIELSVRQVWTEYHNNGSMIEIGCEFVNLSPEQKERINGLVDEHKNLILKGAIMIDP